MIFKHLVGWGNAILTGIPMSETTTDTPLLACPYQNWALIPGRPGLDPSQQRIHVQPMQCIGAQCAAYRPRNGVRPAVCDAHSASGLILERGDHLDATGWVRPTAGGEA